MRETVVVTGALGDAGSWIVDALRKEYEVVAVDRSVPETTDLDGVTFLAVDLTDQGPVWETIVDADPTAVVHFGNIPHEVNHAGGDVYQNNAVIPHTRSGGAGQRGRRLGLQRDGLRHSLAGADAPGVSPGRRTAPGHPVERVRDVETRRGGSGCPRRERLRRLGCDNPAVVDTVSGPVPDHADPRGFCGMCAGSMNPCDPATENTAP